MHLVYDDGSGERDVEVLAREPDLAVSELAVALGAPAGTALRVDDRTLEPGAALAAAGLYEGAAVVSTPIPTGARRRPRGARRRAAGGAGTPGGTVPDPRPLLGITGGLDAGRSWPLDAGATVVGRDPGCDVVIAHPTVSSVHCRIEVRAGCDPAAAVSVADLGSRNGTWRAGGALDGAEPVAPGETLRLGAVALSVRLPPDDRAPALHGGVHDLAAGGSVATVAFNRPPRPAAPAPPAPLRCPAVEPAPGPAPPFSLVSFVAPLVLAGVMVSLLGDARFALFALLSPVMVLGNWLEGRRRRRKQARRARRDLGQALRQFLADLEAARAQEVERRRTSLGDPAEALRRAELPSVRLWERRRDHEDFLSLVAGTGDLRWAPPLDESGPRPPEVERALDELLLQDAPVPVDPLRGPVGLVGDRSAVLAVARSLVCQAATHAGPADLRVAVLTTPAGAAAWDWVKWLPHAADPVSGRRLVIVERAGAEDFLRARLDGDGGPTWLVVVDDEVLATGRSSLARAALASESGRIAGLVMAADGARLPASCRAIVELHDQFGTGRLVRPQDGEAVESFLATGVSHGTARRWARLLARFDDPEVEVPGPGLPPAVHLASIAEIDPFDATQLAGRWRANRGAPLAAPIGVSDGGVVRLDLEALGPHGLVGGTTGSGKSELLRTLVVSLALESGPDEVTFLLLEQEGGAGFDACGALPHVVGVVTDLDEHLVASALRALEGEVRQRERLLRAAGAADLAAYRRARSGRPDLPALPRLVVVVDELATLATGSPRSLDTLVDVAQRGRSLGLHLVLATQHPRDVVGAGIRSNTTLRIALRVQDAADSHDLVGTDAAARIPPELVGRAYLRAGPHELRALQVARVGGTAPAGSEALSVQPFSALPADRPEPGCDPGGAGELARMVEAVNAALGISGLDRPAPLWSDAAGGEVAAASVDLFDLLGIPGAAAIDRERAWRTRCRRDHLRVPIGVDESGEPVLLDLKESAFDGMGPHGLVVGATGSGKSELLRTLLLALAASHSPEALSLVLVDFKGGATFAGMASLPHVAGVITNLADDLSLVDRMRDALYGEQRRRQELLKRAGNLASVDEYTRRRLAGEDLPPLPSLLVVVDEFAELLVSKPDFGELFATIGRLGRSLGIHLLLASQRLDEGRLRGLESNLRYRIGLRTFSTADSRAAIGVDDAYRLPAEPGCGYLKLDSDVLRRFTAAWVSAPTSGDPLGPTQLDVAVARLEDPGRRVHQVWLPPLDRAIPLDRIEQPARPGGAATLSVAVGELDRPEEQAKVPLVLDLGGGEGNVAVVGAPQSGKSTLLRTLVAAFALTHTPLEAQFYCVDCGGGPLQALAGLPHVGTVASRLDVERVRRLVVEVEGVLASREELFRAAGIDSADAFRARRAAGELDGSLLGDVFLVIDGWARFRQEFDELEPVVLDLAARGLGHGVHVVVSSNRWMEIRSNLLDNLGTRLELRLHDPIDSNVDRRAAANVEAGTPGRGIVQGGLHFQAALPRIDGVASASDAAAGLGRLVGEARRAWSGPAAPEIRLLPHRLAFTDLPAAGTGPGIPIGIDEAGLEPVRLDLLGPDPHFLVFGDGESGKTNLLQLFLTGLVAAHGPEQARIVVVDYRRTLLDVVPPDHLVGYAGAAPAAAGLVSRVADVLASRLPPADLGVRQLRERSWWTGGEVYVVVDDYDLVASPTGNPLAALVDFVALGRDLGFHLVLARRVAGAARAAFEPLSARLHEVGAPGIILSGDRQEGPIIAGHRASAQPPGRGLLVHRRRPPMLVQTAVMPALLET